MRFRLKFIHMPGFITSSSIKRICTFIFMVAGLLLCTIHSCYASHGMGGELTWTCLPGGQFIFESKFYRDCNGIPGPAYMSMNTTVPGIPTIQLNLFSQTDISPNGFTANGDTSCPNCIQGNASVPIPGLVEEFSYRSAPINLPGMPPAAGWEFYWGECCRSISIANIIGSSSTGFRVRAIMYPFNITQPCFDSSPYFAEKPATIFCTGSEVKFNASAIDPEQDSLVYSWGDPLTEFGVIIPFAPGYSVNSQLPSPVQNPLNVAAALNPATGEVILVSFTGGFFVIVIKVAAYKCGIKVAEIFREINVRLTNTCSPVYGGVMNSPPTMSAPFIDTGTGLQTSYTDTVIFGDTVSFSLDLTDFDFFTNSSGQYITVSGSGLQFGLNFTDPDSGCALPPCATIANGLPQSILLAGQINFNWVTTCDHVSGVNPQCGGSSTYYFTIHAHDNYCPANGSTIATISITVIGSPSVITATGPSTICEGDTVMLTASGAQTYIWNTGQTGDTIFVTQPGYYSVLSSNPVLCASVSIPTGTLNVTASAALDTICYNWPPVPLTGNPPGGTWTGYGISGQQFNPALTGAGVFELVYQLTDAAGCMGSDTVQMTVNLCTGMSELNASSTVLIYPNPATENSFLQLNGWKNENISIGIYNVFGQFIGEIFNGNPDQEIWEVPINTSLLSKGIYLVKIHGTLNSQIVLLKN